MKPLRSMLLSGFICIFAYNCSHNTAITGTESGSETTNGRVAGSIVNTDGSYGSKTIVKLLFASYDPVKDCNSAAIACDTTNSLGNYYFDDVDSGIHTIEAVNLVNGTRVLISDIDVTNRDTIFVPAAKLELTGSIKISLPDYADIANGYVYIPGTTVYKPLANSSGYVVIDSVPAGIIPAIAYSAVTSTNTNVIRYDVDVKPGASVAVDNPSWKYSKELVLNTTSSGANVQGTVTGFPVLIRLTAANFVFSQAKSAGADLRFGKQNGKMLPYQIEQWDSVDCKAEIWIKADTIFGNDSAQKILMYWGNQNASDSSNGTAVFDTSNGFKGVWHLAESAGFVNDATVDNFNGSRNGNQVRTTGMVGYGQSYIDSGAYSDMGNVLNPGSANMTVSAWVKLSAKTSTYTIIGKTNGGVTPCSNYGWLMAFSNGRLRFYLASAGSYWSDSGSFWMQMDTINTSIDTVSWHNVAAVVDRASNENCRLYIDGEDVTNIRNGAVKIVGAVSNTLPVRIAAEADNDFSCRGSVDETVVSYTVRSADWMKLCYMNQKNEDALVRFK